MVGEIGRRGCRMTLVTAQADLAISRISQGKYVTAPRNKSMRVSFRVGDAHADRSKNAQHRTRRAGCDQHRRVMSG